jgi:hypothetical protein
MLKKILLLPVLVVLLFSCYSHKIYLNSDKKSGRMVIDYTLDDDYLSILSTALSNFQPKDGSPSIDANALIDEKVFRETFKSTKEVTLKVVKIDTTKGYTGHIEVAFTDFEKALTLLPEGMINISVIRQNSGLTISQVLNLLKIDPESVLINFLDQQKEDDINMYNKLTKQAVFVFDVFTPSPIKKSEGVILSPDKKKAEYSFKLSDLLKDKNKDIKFLISF